MSLRFGALAGLLCIMLFAYSQTPTLPSFLTKLLATIPAGTPQNALHLTGHISFIAGSLQETGTLPATKLVGIELEPLAAIMARAI